MLATLDDQAVELPGGDPLREGGPEAMEKIKDPPLLLMDLGGAALELADVTARPEDYDSEHGHGHHQDGDDDGLDQRKAMRGHEGRSCTDPPPKDQLPAMVSEDSHAFYQQKKNSCGDAEMEWVIHWDP